MTRLELSLLGSMEICLDGQPACADRLEQAVWFYRGDFLPLMLPVYSAPFEEWAILKRDLKTNLCH